ncbi:trans-sialidase, putative, partial [Trypanosoma cruzi marinkellei]
MHSRVAAVTAPRTHHRLRVTGSSGRRREGRESEPQRPNMSRHHFYSAALLLLVVMMCCNAGGAAGEALTAQGSSVKKLFVWKDVEGGKVTSLRVPSLVGMNGDVFAVAEAQGTKNDGKSFTGIASKLLMSSNENPKEELDTKQLKTQLLEECSSEEEGNCASREDSEADSQSQTKVLFIRPTTVVNGSDIYMLAGVYVNKSLASCQGVADAKSYELLLVKGNVSVEERNKNRIYWNDTYVIPWNPDDEQPKKLSGLMGGGGSGVRMEDGTLVFPLEGKKNGDTENGGKNS